MRTLPTVVVGILLILGTNSAAQNRPGIPGGLGLAFSTGSSRGIRRRSKSST